MAISTLIQVTAYSALLLGPLSIIGSFLNEEVEKKYPALEWLYFVNNIFMLLAFLGLYLFQAEKGGSWGLAAFLTALVAVMFMSRPGKLFGMEPWEFGGAIIALAAIFIAVASFLAGQFPPIVPGLLLAGIIFGLPGMFIKSFQRTGFILGGIGFGIGMSLAGYFMLTN